MSFVAISTVDFPPALKFEIHAVGMDMLPVARTMGGLISLRFCQSDKKDQTLMVWEWESQACHEACMGSEAWSQIMAKHGPMLSRDDVAFSIETFERLG